MEHIPVMLSEVCSYMRLESGQRCLDMTVGLAGHSAAILKAIAPSGFLLGLDRDTETLPLAYERLKAVGGDFLLRHSDYAKVRDVCAELGLKDFNAILCDCGVSSKQLDDPERGFGFERDCPLDMRLDRNELLKASDLLNTCPENELADIFFNFGDERFSRPIARAIAAKRKTRPFASSEELASLVSGVYYRFGFRRSKVHPATRVFQALRIAVNHELKSLEEGLQGAEALLAPGGRLVVISFHSGEDRIVKNLFRNFKKEGKGTIITKKPLTPGEKEIAENPRSRSALLRVFEKTSGQGENDAQSDLQ
ncbi:16S rRNA (cytosine(1402)-N(4))-methyltransferase RsmH [bacterium]|nr:16S rRNA (cytosine(1402)-N(4))-methyltransferase RsmH [bacterium]